MNVLTMAGRKNERRYRRHHPDDDDGSNVEEEEEEDERRRGEEMTGTLRRGKVLWRRRKRNQFPRLCGRTSYMCLLLFAARSEPPLPFAVGS